MCDSAFESEVSSSTEEEEDADKQLIDATNSQLICHGLVDGCLYNSLKMFRNAGMRTIAFTEFLAYAPLPTHVPPTPPDYMKAVKDNRLNQYLHRKLLNRNTIPDIIIFTLESSAGNINCASFSDDATMLAVGIQNNIFILNKLENQPESKDSAGNVQKHLKVEHCVKTHLQGHNAVISNLEFAHFNNLLVSSADDLTVRVWCMQSWLCLESYSGHSCSIWRVYLSSHYKFIASCGYNSTLRIWAGVENGNLLHTLQYDKFNVYDIDIHPNNNYIATAGSNGLVIIWSVVSGEKVRILKGHKADVLRVKFSACGRYLVSNGKDRNTLIWDIQDAIIVGIIHLPCNEIASIHISEDNEQMFLISYGEGLWFINFSKIIRHYRKEKHPMFSGEYNLTEKYQHWKHWQNQYIIHQMNMKLKNVLCATVTCGNKLYVACVNNVQGLPQ